jgi:hypothetical protein
MKYADYLAYINETVNLPEGGTGRRRQLLQLQEEDIV